MLQSQFCNKAWENIPYSYINGLDALWTLWYPYIYHSNCSHSWLSLNIVLDWFITQESPYLWNVYFCMKIRRSSSAVWRLSVGPWIADKLMPWLYKEILCLTARIDYFCFVLWGKKPYMTDFLWYKLRSLCLLYSKYIFIIFIYIINIFYYK